MDPKKGIDRGSVGIPTPNGIDRGPRGCLFPKGLIGIPRNPWGLPKRDLQRLGMSALSKRRLSSTDPGPCFPRGSKKGNHRDP